VQMIIRENHNSRFEWVCYWSPWTYWYDFV